MTDETKQTQVVETSKTDAAQDVATEKRTEIKDLPPEIQGYIEELRRENAKHRTEKKRAEDAARKAEEDKLTAQAEWKTLAEQRAARLAELERVAEQKEAIESAFNAGLEARLKAIPEDKRKRLVEPVRKTMSALEFAAWLDANEGDLKAVRPPNFDAGAGSQSATKTVDLTSEELEIVRKTGISPEAYAKRKAEIQRERSRE